MIRFNLTCIACFLAVVVGWPPSACSSDCSEPGRYAVVNVAPGCVYESDYYRAGRLPGGCEFGGTCYYVDALDGDDGNPGTFAEPWQSIAHVNTAMNNLTPGDHVLFHRGREWQDTTLRIRDVVGVAAAPVSFGAYNEGSRPRVYAIYVEDSSHVTVRDLEQIDSTSGPCTKVTSSDKVTLQDLAVRHCSNNRLSLSAPYDPGRVIANSVAPAPIAHWSFDEASGLVAEDSANDHDGALGGMDGTEWTDGLLGGGLRLDGIDDSIQVPAFDVIGSAFSISAWVRADGFDHLNSRDGRVLSKASGTAEQDHDWMLSTIASGAETRFRFRLRTDGETSTLIASQGDVPTGVWVHVAAVFDGSAMKLYQNGVEVGSQLKSGSLGLAPGVGVALGNQPTGADSRPFDGVLDDICLFDAALSSTEVASISDGGLGSSCGDLGAVTPTLTVSGTCPGTVELHAAGLTPNSAAALLSSEVLGQGTLSNGLCAGIPVDLQDPRLVSLLTADEQGESLTTRTVQAAACDLFLQAVDGTTCETTGPETLPPPATPCDCSGHGQCVELDGEPTCACDSGYYGVGLSCLRDPCELSGTCYYVDAQDGDDSNLGTRSDPWRTIERVNDAMSSLVPGDHVLFHRDREWEDTTLRVRDVAGTEDAPVTVGAYDEGDRPRLWAIRVEDSSHITVRDFEQIGSPSGPCTQVTDSGYVTLQDLQAHDCSNNGLSFGAAVHHGVMIDNRVWDIFSNDALSIHDPGEVTPDTVVGDHHWVVDNIVTGTVDEQPIDIASGTDTVPGSYDHKIVGNRVRGGGNGCFAVGHGTSYAWIVGNFGAECTRTKTGGPMLLSGFHGALSGNYYQVVGNVLFSNLMSSMDVRGEYPNVTAVSAEHNTFTHTGIGARAVVRSSETIELSMHHSIISPTGTQAHVAITSDDHVGTMDDNWYLEADRPGCRIQGRTLAQWQIDTPHDARSSCGSIPGLTDPPQELISDVDAWLSSEFLDHFIPDPEWTGCSENIGAFSCSGNLNIEFKPFDDYLDNDGYGWEGPLIVRQRYRLRPDGQTSH